jgi:hypothetical protein
MAAADAHAAAAHVRRTAKTHSAAAEMPATTPAEMHSATAATAKMHSATAAEMSATATTEMSTAAAAAAAMTSRPGIGGTSQNGCQNGYTEDLDAC